MTLRYKIEIQQLKDTVNKKDFEQYKYDNGYIVLYWRVENDPKGQWSFYGFISQCGLKFELGEKNYNKFLKGQRIFTA